MAETAAAHAPVPQASVSPLPLSHTRIFIVLLSVTKNNVAKNVIITYNKSLINCDILLDDAEHNLINFKGIKVLFDAPYNKNSTVADFRVTSWKDFYELVTELKIAGIGDYNDK